MERKKRSKSTKVLLFIIGVELVGMLSGLLSGDMKGLYSSLVKPPLSPPGWVFGVVWLVLYALMGIAAYLVYQQKTPESKDAIFWFEIQLGVNFLWSIIFFRYQLFWAAFVAIVLLDLLVIYTIGLFRKIDKTAARLMIPYLLWILFATYLNLGVAILN